MPSQTVVIEAARRAASLVPLDHLSKVTPISLDRVLTVVGSGTAAHVRLHSSAVSRVHAVFLNANGVVYLRDTASRGGLYVNGRRVARGALRHGDEIRMEDVRFRFEDTEPATAASHDDTNPPVSAIPPIELVNPSGAGGRRITEPVALIGRREIADLSLEDSSISNAHALLFYINGRWLICDLGSRTGTRVNGKPVQHAQVRHGDLIQVGTQSLRLRRSKSSAGVSTTGRTTLYDPNEPDYPAVPIRTRPIDTSALNEPPHRPKARPAASVPVEPSPPEPSVEPEISQPAAPAAEPVPVHEPAAEEVPAPEPVASESAIPKMEEAPAPAEPVEPLAAEPIPVEPPELVENPEPATCSSPADTEPQAGATIDTSAIASEPEITASKPIEPEVLQDPPVEAESAVPEPASPPIDPPAEQLAAEPDPPDAQSLSAPAEVSPAPVEAIDDDPPSALDDSTDDSASASAPADEPQPVLETCQASLIDDADAPPPDPAPLETASVVAASADVAEPDDPPAPADPDPIRNDPDELPPATAGEPAPAAEAAEAAIDAPTLPVDTNSGASNDERQASMEEEEDIPAGVADAKPHLNGSSLVGAPAIAESAPAPAEPEPEPVVRPPTAVTLNLEQHLALAKRCGPLAMALAIQQRPQILRIAPPPPAQPEPRRHHKALAISLTTLVVLGGAAAAWWFYYGQP